jgi:prohibitin 2
MKKLLTTIFLCGSILSCSQIDAGQVGVKTTYGKVTGNALSAGLYFYIPFVNKIYKLNTKVQTVHQDSQASSKDLQNVQTEITLNYHLGTQDPVNHYIRLGADQSFIENSIVQPAMSETFKAVVAQYTAEELITKRQIVSDLIISNLSNRLKQYDLYVDSTAITNFKFSQSFSDAIEAKQVAEQNANKAKNDLQRIQVEAQQKIAEAQGQAQAMQLQKQVVTPELISLKQLEIQSEMIKKWDGKYPTTYMGTNNPMSLLLNQINK